MIYPTHLKEGDAIGLIAPGGKVEKDYIIKAEKMFKKWGLNVLFGKHLFKSCSSFSGTDDQRAEDLQTMLDHQEIKAIVCARGGYGLIRLIDMLDFRRFQQFPKWITGFSDVTVLHSIVNNLNIATFHATMPVNFKDSEQFDDSLLTLKHGLFGKKLEYLTEPFRLNIPGKVNAVLAGGNLTTLFSLRGTRHDIRHDKILFIEDVGENLYHIDRMMMNFKLGGILENIKGLIVGQFTDISDNKFTMHQLVHDIIHEKVKDYNYPVMFNFPAGHGSENKALVMGSHILLEVNKEGAKIIF